MARGMRGGAPQWWTNFQNSKFVSGTKKFLDSNTLAAKFAFIILVIIGFVIIMRLFIDVFTWMSQPSTDTYLWQGNHMNPLTAGCRRDANLALTVPTDPSAKGNPVPILRSKNDWPGMDFTWGTWIWINPNNVGEQCQACSEDKRMFKHVFSKGLPASTASPSLLDLTENQDNGPSVYLETIAPQPSTANSAGHSGRIDMIVLMNTYGSTKATTVTIKDMPLRKWVHVTIRLSKQVQLDTYINGTLDNRTILPGIARQNYGDVYVTQMGGFNGYIAGLRYTARALGTSEIDRIVDAGPQSDCASTSGMDARPHYLSTRWYFAGAGDGYNPTSNEYGS